MVVIEVAFSWQSRQMVILFSNELTTSDCVFQLYFESSRRSKFYLQIYIEIYSQIRPGGHPSNRTILPKIRLTGHFLGHPSNRTIGNFGQTHSTCYVT